ncbi:MAG: ATP-dependent Clp protease ATP-binding subunit ClpX, partial [candidate division KSB1 bacterium]|nr:ATP-dependent Clp protease ATP-binding subunit ClpX [candidate division KSB1 bacterium]
KKSMGVGAEIHKQQERKINEILQMVEPEDLLQFGLIPELIGRLPIECIFEELSEEALYSILIEPKNALTKQYKKLFELDGVELEFEEAALRAIVKEAMKRRTGARALRAIMEDIMLDIMFNLPELKNVKKVIITEQSVKNKNDVLFIYHEIKKTA